MPLPLLIDGNRVELLPRRGPLPPNGDYRPQPGGPLQVGQRATLCFRAEPTDPTWPDWEYVTVRVTEGEQFRGEVEADPYAGFIAPEKLHKGTILTFCFADVHEFPEVL